MKIFISSLIRGFEEFRDAARSAVKTLRHEPMMAEEFGARPKTPQVACLQEIRSADLVVLILGERYGVVENSSDLSPTHEEYLEARDTKPILMFVQEGVAREAKQEQFVSEAQGWLRGQFRDGFSTAEELRSSVTRAIHEYELAHAVGPLDIAALIKNATELIPKSHQNQSLGSPRLNLAVVGGPIQRILRPSEIESSHLVESLHQHALFVQPSIFDKSKGVEDGIEQAALFLNQGDGSCIRLNEQGSLLLRLPLDLSNIRNHAGFGGLAAIIEETVVQQLNAALQYANWTLDHIDATQRLTHLALAASIDGSDHLGWRTQAEHDASPNTGTMRRGGSEARLPVNVHCPRAALRFEAHRLAEDLMVPLRRQRKNG